MFFKILLCNITLLLFPVNLHMQHAVREFAFLNALPVSATVVVGIVLAVCTLRFVKKREALFGLWWFVIAIFPFLGLFQFGTNIAKHWLYIPTLGLVLAAGALGIKRTGKLLLVGGVIFLTILTIRQNHVWENDLTLYQYTAQSHSADPDIHYNLGNAYLRRICWTKPSGNTRPSFHSSLITGRQSTIWGIVLEKKGQIQKAYGMCARASLLEPKKNYSQKNMFRLAESFGFSASSACAAETGSIFNHSTFGELLKKYVHDGWVDYRGLQKDRRIMDEYLSRVTTFEPGTLRTLPANEQIAFYINVYNALTIRAILDNYPVKSIRDIRGVWNKAQSVVAREPMTLNHIEHAILRKQFREPRIHFAIVCASKSCAKLRSEAYAGKDLNIQLDEQTRDFIRDFRKNRFEKENNTLYLSTYFRWFGEDFGDVPTFVAHYLPNEDARLILAGKVRIKYLPYDWTLNER